MPGQDGEPKAFYSLPPEKVGEKGTKREGETVSDPIERLIQLIETFKAENSEYFGPQYERKRSLWVNQNDKMRDENVRRLDSVSIRKWREEIKGKLIFRLRETDEGTSGAVFENFFPTEDTEMCFPLFQWYDMSFAPTLGSTLMQEIGVIEPGGSSWDCKYRKTRSDPTGEITLPLPTSIQGLEVVCRRTFNLDKKEIVYPDFEHPRKWKEVVVPEYDYTEIFLRLTPQALKDLVLEKKEDSPQPRSHNEKPKAKETLLLDQEVCWSEKRGRKGNLTNVIEAHRKSHPELWESLKGKRVLLKLNLVDPDHPDSCTHPDSLRIILENLAKQGVGEVLIGDETSGVYQRAHPGESLEEVFQKLGYAKRIPAGIKYSLVDFSKLPAVSLGPSAPKIREIPEVAAVINLVKPKEHGQYYFSCGCKNLVGLVPTNERSGFFHDKNHLSQAAEVLAEYIREGKYTDERDMVKIWIEAAKRDDPKNMEKMAGFVKAMREYFQQKKVPLLTIMDGTTVQRHHEHTGPEEKLDVAGIGLDPVAVDLLAMQKLGIAAEGVDYLNLMAGGHEPSRLGDEVAGLPKKRLSRIVDPDSVNVFTDEGGQRMATFYFAIH